MSTAGRRPYIWVFAICVASSLADLMAVLSLTLIMAQLLDMPLPAVVLDISHGESVWPEAAAFVVASVWRLGCNAEIARIGQYGEAKLSERIFSDLVQQDVAHLAELKTSDLKRQILSEVQQFSNNLLYPTLRIAQAVPSVLLISISVAWSLGGVFWVAAALLALVFFGTLTILRVIAESQGGRRFRANEKRFSEIENTFINIRFIKTLGLENRQIGIYAEAMRDYALAQTVMQTLGQVPKFIFEILLVIAAATLMSSGIGTDEKGGFVLTLSAAYRMLPTLQVIAQNAARIRFGRASIDDLHTRFNFLESAVQQRAALEESLTGCYEIEIEHHDRFTFSDVPDSLAVLRSGTLTAIAGPSGAGKTTLLDNIAGLRNDNGIIIRGRRRGHADVFYVPQQAFLPSGNFADILDFFNIRYDFEALNTAFADFNLQHLTERVLVRLEPLGGSQEFAGLSGGESKRLFLLVAAVSGRGLIILDEPFAGLDDKAMREMSYALNRLKGSRTILLVTHALPSELATDQVLTLRKLENE